MSRFKDVTPDVTPCHVAPHRRCQVFAHVSRETPAVTPCRTSPSHGVAGLPCQASDALSRAGSRALLARRHPRVSRPGGPPWGLVALLPAPRPGRWALRGPCARWNTIMLFYNYFSGTPPTSELTLDISAAAAPSPVGRLAGRETREGLRCASRSRLSRAGGCAHIRAGDGAERFPGSRLTSRAHRLTWTSFDRSESQRCERVPLEHTVPWEFSFLETCVNSSQPGPVHHKVLRVFPLSTSKGTCFQGYMFT